MSVTVTLHIFSGRPDPAWELSDDQARELADRLSSIQQTTLLKPPGIAGGLGYRGFSIQSVRESKLDPHVYVHAGIADLSRFDLNRALDNADLEEWLLSTAGEAVDSSLQQHITSEIQGAAKTFKSLSAQPGAMLAVPPYDPGKWNNDPNIRQRNNCYNYANDKITNTFAQPGRGSGQEGPYPPDCSGTGAAAQRDGQVPVSSASSTPAQGHFIALVIWPGYDYHWYRLDNNTQWSHKPGQTPAKNTDNSGNLITDPNSCDRGPYTAFCGYYHCKPTDTKIL